VNLLVDQFADLLEQAKVPADRPRVLVVGLPGPVDVARGMAVRPPIMPGWDGFPVAERLAGELGCPSWWTTTSTSWRSVRRGRCRPSSLPVLFVTVGAGIGAGFVLADGTLHRGADGAAGDIGHIRVPGAEEVVCRCGKAGCVEAVASTAALARRLAATGEPPLDGAAEDGAAMRAFLARLRDGLPDALHAVRAAGATLGEVIALCIHMLNPRHVVVGGESSRPATTCSPRCAAWCTGRPCRSPPANCPSPAASWAGTRRWSVRWCSASSTCSRRPGSGASWGRAHP
jgi:predicted NBD/HSP70 family sugar kinase